MRLILAVLRRSAATRAASFARTSARYWPGLYGLQPVRSLGDDHAAARAALRAPMSMISRLAMTSRLCSLTMTVLPLSARDCGGGLDLQVLRPVVGSSKHV